METINKLTLNYADLGLFAPVILFALLAILHVKVFLHFSMSLPYFRSFLKLKELKHNFFPLKEKVLSSERHSLANLMVKSDGEQTLWARTSMKGSWNAGFVLKMALSKAKDEVIKTELMFSPLLLVTFLACAVFAFLSFNFAFPFFNTVTGQPDDGVIKFAPYLVFPTLLLGYWSMLRQYFKQADQFLSEMTASTGRSQ